MRFKPAVRRPDGRPGALPLLFGVMPLLLGGVLGESGVIDTRDFSGPGGGSPVPDSASFWLFFTESGWGRLHATGNPPEIPGRVRVTSRWLRALSVQVPSYHREELARLPGVDRVVPVRRLTANRPRGPASETVDSREEVGSRQVPPDSVYGDLGPILSRMEITSVHGLGFLGTGVRVGILDGSFLPTHRTVQARPPAAARDFVDGDASVDPAPEDPPGSASHGTALWSLVGGDWPGTLRGAAPEASLLLARVSTDADPVSADEDRWVAGLEWLESQGARVVLSGFGFRNFESGRYGAGDLNGDVAPATLAADEAARRGVLVVAPIGNGGPEPGTLQSPADGDSVLSVGALSPLGTSLGFSGRGPTADGRPKPELFAVGGGVPAAQATSNEALGLVEGTEFAAALLAGAAALLVEAHPDRGPMELVGALEGSAASPASGTPVPRVAPALLFPDGILTLPSQDVGAGGRVTSLAPRFQWDVPTTLPQGLPVTFLLEFSEDPEFQGVLLRDSVVGIFARRLPEPLPPRTTLFWRVRARSAQGVTLATPAQGPLTVPSWVTLEVLNGPTGTQVSDPQPELRWTPVALPPPAGPFTFDVQVVLDREGEVLRSHEGLVEPRLRLPEPLPFNIPLRWRVIARARSGQVDTVASVAPFVVTGDASPPVTILYQNFPNPFPNADEGTFKTRIWFDLARESRVELAVFDLRGRLVRSLIPVDGCGPIRLPPGLYGRQGPSTDPCIALSWDGRDEGGRELAPGVYLLRLQAGGVVEVRRVVYWP